MVITKLSTMPPKFLSIFITIGLMCQASINQSHAELCQDEFKMSKSSGDNTWPRPHQPLIWI
jgi:hypothetical protein